MTDFQKLLASASGRHVVVVGDVMLDELARGDVRRISPEAPVPVLEVTSRSYALGGAANAAANVASLGGKASLIGIVGTDPGAERIATMLQAQGIEPRLVADASRPTTHKTRLVARGQQIVRIDQESRSEPDAKTHAEIVAAVDAAAASADAFVLSDYAKGAISAALVQAVVRAAKARNIPIVADPKHKDLGRYRGVSVITPNHNELEVAVGRPLNDDADFAKAATEVLPLLEGGALLATRGADGMTLFEPGAASIHVKAAAKSVFDVTGAGDTVVATLAIALAGGARLADAIVAASVAAGIVVSKEGTASVTPAELLAAAAADTSLP